MVAFPVQGVVPYDAALKAYIDAGGRLVGTGAPEGVVTAPVGTVYADLASTTGASTWRKATGVGNTGWVVSDADTGNRGISGLINSPATGNTGSAGCTLRRDRSTVTLYIDALWSSWTSGNALMTVPSGFRANNQRYLDTGYSTPAPIFMDGSGALLLFASGSNPGSRWMFTWPTVDPWPTSLPGTAV